MSLLLCIADTDYPPPGTSLVGELVVDRPRVNGVLPQDVSGVIQAEIQSGSRLHFIPHRRVEAPRRDGLCHRLRRWTGQWTTS